MCDCCLIISYDTIEKKLIARVNSIARRISEVNLWTRLCRKIGTESNSCSVHQHQWDKHKVVCYRRISVSKGRIFLTMSPSGVMDDVRNKGPSTPMRHTHETHP